ncbi:F-BAR and double SH3 domains protein, partial [Schistosoma japonicum]
MSQSRIIVMNVLSIKPLNQLKTIHNEHYAKLQSKHASETDLLDDLRVYCKQRAIIEREYGQSLQKLVNSFLSKKEFTSSCSSGNDGILSNKQHNVWHVWYSLLTESNSLALSRLRTSDIQQRLSNELKPLKSQRLSVNKRVFEQLKILQSDLAACVQEMVKSHKVYAEEEKQAQDTRLKTLTAKEKIQRRSTDIFHTMAQLHRNYDKLLGKRQAFDSRSATARNEYLFQLTAINAHLKHYFNEDLPVLAKTLDGELYEKLGEVFTTLCENEIEFCTITLKQFDNLFKEATQINRTNAWEDFLKSSPLFDKPVQYQFEPIKGDETTMLCSATSESNLEQIARKLSRRLVIRERCIKSYENEMKVLQAGYVTSLSGMINVTNHQTPPSPLQRQQQQTNSETENNNEELLAFNQEYVENKVEELQFAIRREKIEHVKIEACLSLLRNSSINVNEFIVEARIAAEAAAAASQLNNDNSSNTGLLNQSIHNTRSTILPIGEGSNDSATSISGMNEYIDQDPRLLSDWDQSYKPYGSEILGRNTAYSSQRSFNIDDDDSDGPTSRFHRNGINDWSSTFPRPIITDQMSGAVDKSLYSTYKSSLQTSKKANYPVPANSSPIKNQSCLQHDYQNVAHINSQARDNVTIHKSTNNKSYKDDTFSSVHVSSSDNLSNNKDDTDFEALWSENNRLHRATVVHEFRAKKPNELDLVVHETVVLLNNESQNGWIKVRSLIDGNEGLVPISYLKLSNSKVSTVNSKTLLNSNDSNSNQDNLMQHANKNEAPHPKSTVFSEDTDQKNSLEQYQVDPVTLSLPPETNAPRFSGTDEFIVNEIPNHEATKPPLSGSFVRSLIDFCGTNPDELSFKAGAVIRIIGRAPNINELINSSSTTKRDQLTSLSGCSIDDGWWEGDLLIDGTTKTDESQKFYSIRGVFPSMIVQPLSSIDSEVWSVRWHDILPLAT